MKRYGTAHFVGVLQAIKYYLSQGLGRTDREAALLVDQKVAAGEIKIGKPDVPHGWRLITLDDDCRYGLEECHD